MQKRKIKRLDQREIAGQGKRSTGAKAGRKNFSKKSGKGSSRSRKRGKGGRAGGGKRRQRGRQDTAYKIADLLPQDTIKKLKEMKRVGKS